MLPAHEAPEHSPKQNAIIIFHEPLKVVRRLLGDEIKDEKVKAGDFVLGPSKVPHAARWDEPASFSIISIEQECISHAEHESINPDLFELLPQLAKHDPIVCGAGQAFISILESGHPIGQMCIDSLLLTLNARLLEKYSLRKPKLIENYRSLSNSDLLRVIDYIHGHLDRKIGIPELARLLSMSDSYFSRQFKNSTGLSPLQYLIKLRMEKAASLLVSTDLDLGSIAKRVGYLNQDYLVLAFRRYFLINPCGYRERSGGRAILY